MMAIRLNVWGVVAWGVERSCFGDSLLGLGVGDAPARHASLPEVVLDRAYRDAQLLRPQIPDDEGIVPPLIQRVSPGHAIVPLDLYIPGCPPSAKRIRAVLEQIVAGKPVEMVGREMLKFG